MPVRQRGADKRFWHSCSDRRQTGAFRAFAQGRKCLEQPIGGLISSSLDVNIQRNPKYLWHNALLHPCNAWILAPGSSQRPNKMKKTRSNSYMWWIDHCLTYTFKSTTRYVDPTIWAQPELPHEQVIRAHGYPKIPVNSRTSSCFSVSQRLSRWELDAICHLFDWGPWECIFGELMTWTCWIDRLTMLKSPWIQMIWRFKLMSKACDERLSIHLWHLLLVADLIFGVKLPIDPCWVLQTFFMT